MENIIMQQEVIRGNRLIQGECLAVMDRLIEEGITVDAIITDPPYGTVKDLGDSDKIKHGMKNKTKWDKVIPITPMFEKCEKLLREGGVCILFGQEPYTSNLINNQHGNLPFSYRNIWLKDHFANSLIAKKAPLNYYEDISIFFKKYDSELSNPLRKYAKCVFDYINKPKTQIFKDMGNQSACHFFRPDTMQFIICTEKCYIQLIELYDINKMDNFMEYRDMIKLNKKRNVTFNLWEGGKYKSNIFKYKKDYNSLHITAKPVLLMEDLIKTYSNEGDLILDFTAGSFTTLVACYNLNRRGIGIELEEKYFDIGVERIKNNLTT